MKLAVEIMAVAVSVFFAADAYPEKIDFRMKLVIIRQEVSKDSHEDAYEIIMKGRTVDYRWRHSGFPDDMEEKKSFRLSEAAFDNLVRYILAHNMNRDLKEKNKTGQPGVGITMRLDITIDSSKTKAYISGMYNKWGVPQEQRCTIKNMEYYSKAYHILTVIRDGKEDF
ncbi:MAG TPA: hypothetical protein PLC28_19955 [Spirochaetota bacterium]|nr:hypothetical protein [Spirochaetota bacterium]HPC43209.1 hypothetical protein [Spirochaetota bacterium]HQJ72983.1 hypothetical protein [Spirochaetota bacterium]HRS79269.1 hypothetical protein [Spirochaetota bacterium]HRT77183.1 hypothetical protein [Spirochaetota bacterium]